MTMSESFKTVVQDGYRRVVELAIGKVESDASGLSIEIRCNKVVLLDAVVSVFRQIFTLDIQDRKRQQLRELTEAEVVEFLAFQEKQLRNEYFPRLLEGESLRIPGEWQTDLVYDEKTKTAELSIRDAYSPGHKRGFFIPENLQKLVKT